MTESSRAHREWRAFVAAVEFLTRIPVRRRTEYSSDDLPRSTPYFPLVGLMVGASGGVVFAIAHMFWPPGLAVVLSIAATVRLTGAFHEDAVADVFDGFGGGWNREQIFAIMKDSRVGAYGMVGLTLVLLTKALALNTIAGNGATDDVSRLATDISMMQAMIAGHVVGRWSSLPLLWRYPYVRATSDDGRQGTGKPFASSATTSRLFVGTSVALLLVALVAWPRAIIVVIAGAGVTTLCGCYFRRRIGGITGDTLGAANQFVEVATYLALAAAPHFS